MRRALIIPIILLSGCVSQDPWTKTDTIMQTAVYIAMAADAHSTTLIKDHPNLIEGAAWTQAVLGDNPETTDTWLYFGTLALSHFLIARALPKGWRSAWQGYFVWAHATAVSVNHESGLYGEPCTRFQEINPCP